MTSRIKIAAAVAALATVVAGFAAAADAANRHVLVINRTNHRLINLYAAGHEYEGDHAYYDWLGRNVLRPGESIDINFDDDSGDCDMAVVGKFSDGGTAERESFNVCTQSRLVLTGD